MPLSIARTRRIHIGMPKSILRRKLTPPLLPNTLPRGAVFAAFDEAIAAGRHLALIAGSGYGKSTALATWCGAHATAWVTLDAEDADLDTFLAYLIAACERACPAFRSEAKAMLGRARERDGAIAALSALIADLDEQIERPLCVVLDDYHLAASPGLDALLLRLIKYLPASVRLAIATRRQPEIEIASLQAAQAIQVVGEQELAFTQDEIRQLRPELDAASAAQLLAATGGWPAAMGLTPELRDAYLQEQILAKQPSDVVASLYRLALVDAFDAALCQEALDLPLSAQRRDWLLEQRLIFARDQGHFVLQPQLREYLRRHQHAGFTAAERARLLRAIGDYYWRRGQEATALRFWIDAGEAAWAAERLVAVADSWLADGRLDALGSALAALAAEAEHPELLSLQGELHRRWGELERAEALFERAVAGFEQHDDAHGLARARLRLAQTAASRGDVVLARARLADARAALSDDPRACLDVLNLEGGLELLAGSTAQAIASFEAAVHLSGRLGDAYAEARSIHNLGVCYTRLGEFHRALDCYESAARYADGTPYVWMTPINRALLLIYLDRPREAAQAAEAVLDGVRRYGLRREEGYALRILGFAHLRNDELEAARACFESAELLGRRANDALGIAYSLNFQAELATVQRDGATAWRLSQEVERLLGGPERLHDVPDFAQLRAKACLLTGRLDEAASWLEALDARAREANHRHLLADIAQMAQDLAALRAGEATRVVPQSRAAASPGREPELAITCFGGLHVRRRGVEIAEREWQSVRAKCLLVYLLHAPEGAPKAQLFEAVYPHGDGSDASMNMALMRLRKALEPGLERGQASRFVLRGEGRYSFNRQAHVALDTQAFEQLLRGTYASAAAERGALEQALDLYRGPFLPEFSEPWAEALRQRFQDLALAACARLLVLYEAEAPERLLDLLHRALDIDPLSAEFNRELILRFLEADEPHRALQHYRLCERRYQQLLDSSPPEDLAQLVAGF